MPMIRYAVFGIRYSGIRVFGFLCLAVALLVPQLPTLGQPLPRMLILSQPSAEVKNESFVNLGPQVARELEPSGKFDIVVYSESLPAVRQALAAKTLAPADLAAPVSKESGRKIARVLGASYLLLVSGRVTKDGIAGESELEQLTGQQTWSSVFFQKLDPYSPKGKKPSLVEGITAHAATIAQRVTAKPGSIPVTPPVEVSLKPAKSTGKKPGQPTTAQSSQPTGPPSASNAAKQPVVESNPGPVIESPPPAAVNTVSANEILVERFRQSGDLANLIVSLRRAVNDKPKDAKLRRDLVRSYLERGWTAAARDEATRALAISPGDPALHRLLGDCCLDGDPDKALAEYQEAVKLDGKSAANQVALGDAYWNLARAEEAQRAYVEAAQSDPKSPLPHRRLARIYAQRGKFGESAAEMATARAMTPAEDLSSLAEDSAAILAVADSGLTEVMSKLQAARKSLVDGTKNREQSFTEAGAQKKRAEEIAGFLDSLQTSPTFMRIQSLYAQAASLVVQSAEASLDFVETQSTRRDEEATLLRVEASKLMTEAAKKLKAQAPQRAAR